MDTIHVERAANRTVGRQAVEFVEREGLGHPDSICDQLMEAISIALCREYLVVAGRVLHHNLDKGLLVAGQTTPRLGGGVVEVPIRLIFGDRATMTWEGRPLPVNEVAVETAKRWLREHLRSLDVDRHVVFQSEIRPGSAELMDLFERETMTANDTSIAVGFAPLTETERLVLAAERWLNSPEFKRRCPDTGEDIKVMGVRHGRELEMTVAIAFVDRYITSERSYFERKDFVRHELQRYLESRLETLDHVMVHLNLLDAPGRGPGGMYLTVLGTSAECGDGGEVGRGNRVNGVISPNRPMTMEAAAGKNPVSHVGKIYNLLAHRIAARIHETIEPIEEVYVWLCSQIGRPLDQPWFSSVQVELASGAALGDVESPIRRLVGEELGRISQFTEQLARGELPIQ
jgi:S-adenosylmethionine synthetase